MNTIRVETELRPAVVDVRVFAPPEAYSNPENHPLFDGRWSKDHDNTTAVREYAEKRASRWFEHEVCDCDGYLFMGAEFCSMTGLFKFKTAELDYAVAVVMAATVLESIETNKNTEFEFTF